MVGTNVTWPPCARTSRTWRRTSDTDLRTAAGAATAQSSGEEFVISPMKGHRAHAAVRRWPGVSRTPRSDSSSAILRGCRVSRGAGSLDPEFPRTQGGDGPRPVQRLRWAGMDAALTDRAAALSAYHDAHVVNCERCPLSRTRTQVVTGSGDPNAAVMFVGEAPGYHEDRLGVPFVGQAGKL